jgi:hypothetical protein
MASGYVRSILTRYEGSVIQERGDACYSRGVQAGLVGLVGFVGMGGLADV